MCFSKSIEILCCFRLVLLIPSCIFKLTNYGFLVAVKLCDGGLGFLFGLNLNLNVVDGMILLLVFICTHFRQGGSPRGDMIFFEAFELSCQKA